MPDVHICKKCGRKQEYTHRSNYLRAEKENRLCRWCIAKSENRIDKIRKAHIGKKVPTSVGEKISEAKTGHTVLIETRKKLSELSKGRLLSEEHKEKIRKGLKNGGAEKISNSLKGRKLSKETIEKMSKSKIGNAFRKGKKLTLQQKEKISIGNMGKIMSNESKKRCRISAIKRIERNLGYQLYPNFNAKACQIIEEYGKNNGYNFQHALNGGEFFIKDLGYWVDGYDKEKNVIIEIDEKQHFDLNGNLKERDMNRQSEIKQLMNCKFIRLKFEENE